MIIKIKKRYHRKIFYIQGLCSLILVLVVGSVIFEYNIINKERCINICYLSSKLNSNPHSGFYPYNDSLPAKRNYCIIDIKPKSDSFFKKIEELIVPIEKNKDTINGVKIIFNKNIKYGQYVRTINVLLKNNIKTFVPFGDTIFVYYLNRNNPNDILKDNIPRERIIFYME